MRFAIAIAAVVLVLAGPAASSTCVRPSTQVLICAAFPRSQCATAVRVAWCESKFDPHAVNASDHFGLFQMGRAERERYGGSTFNVVEQIAAAYRYWLVAGWRPWACR